MKIAFPFQLAHDAFGRLVLTDADGQSYVGVEPIHAFPITDPDHWVSLCTAEGQEIVWIEKLADLPADVREVVRQELAQREFLPVITSIVNVSTLVEPSQWTVETDRGPTQFLLNAEEDVKRLGAYRTLIVDSQGLRYLIPDTRALDAGSRRTLDRYV